MSAEAEPKSQVDESSAAKARKRRRALPTVLIVLATVVGIISVFALWAQRQLMEQDTWSNTSQQLVENGEIQSALSDFIVTSIYDNVDVEQSLADRLPPDLAPIAGPVASALRGPTEDRRQSPSAAEDPGPFCRRQRCDPPEVRPADRTGRVRLHLGRSRHPHDLKSLLYFRDLPAGRRFPKRPTGSLRAPLPSRS